ncbi:MAG: hypothetical protein R2730_09995 [Chitinophagales bacterium]
MTKKNILFGWIIVAILTSCDVLEQIANQNKGQQGNNGNETILQGEVGCTADNRYTNTIFPANKVKIFKDIPYATMRPEDQWNNGIVDAECYGGKPYKFPAENGLEELRMDIYMPDPSVDRCPERGLIILVHPGGFAQQGTPGKADVAGQAKFMTQLGFVVAAIDYRKGFDWLNDNTYEKGSLAELVFPTLTVNCSESKEPDPKSFQVSLFRFMQDIRAAHRFLHKNADKIGFDTDKIFYAGLSTGAIGIAHAAYALDETSHWSKFGLGKIEDFGNHPELESQIKLAGVLAEQPALHKVDWLEASDNVPIFMMQGAADKDVPFTQGHLAGLTSYHSSTKDLPYFKLFGSKAMYDQMKTFGNNTLSKGKLIAFEGINHHLAPMIKGGCPRLNGGQRGVWMEAYKFAKVIMDAVDKGQTPDLTTGYCLITNATQANCQAVCE